MPSFLSRPLRRLLGAGALATLIAAPSAQAATRYAAPAGSGSTCAATAPCAVADAVSGAASGDDVVLAAGDYPVTSPLHVSAGITVEGTPGQPRPRLLGDPSLSGNTVALGNGATARHLEIHAADESDSSLQLTGATGEDLVLVSTSNGGSAAVLKGAPSGTLLRNALAICRNCGDAAVAFADGQNQGDATVAGVTAVAVGRGAAVDSDLSDGTVTLVDVATSGAGRDIRNQSDGRIHVSFSAFRPDRSGAIADGGGNVGAPVFVDPGNGDYHQAAGSPTIDAGVLDARTGAVDLDGNPRQDGAPDIGAYETTAAAAPPTADALGETDTPLTDPTATAPGDPLGGSLAPVGTPVRGRSVAIRPASGTVTVRLPGAAHDVALTDAASLPLGAVIDATRGTVALTSASSAHGSQTGLFSGGRFRVRQTAGAKPMTVLALTGGNFASCPRAGSASAAAVRPKGPARKLWGRDKGGHFTTIGRSASATVRGTRWLTEDTCQGTRITVAQGAVMVHPPRRGRNILVRAGHSAFVRAAR